jgi:hypothetical protein
MKKLNAGLNAGLTMGGWRRFILVFLSGMLWLQAGRAAELEIHTFGSASLQKIATAQGGHPYWVVLWDLECPYCVKSLKNLAAEQKKNPKLRVYTVSSDSIEETPALRQRLSDIGINSTAYAYGDEAAEALRFAIDPSWRGEKPRAYFYPAQGPRKTLSGVLTEARILAQ